MKKTLFIALLAAVALAACSDKKDSSTIGNAPQQEADNSKAAQATWDRFLIGSWKYVQADVAEKPKYAFGVETFSGDGGYANHTEDGKGNKVVLRGTWQLDDDEDYTLQVHLTSKQMADQRPTKLDETLTYIVLSLEPGKQLDYFVDKHARKAQWLEQSDN